MGALMRLIRPTGKVARAIMLSILLVVGFCLPAWGAGTCPNFIAAGGFEYDEIILVVDDTRKWVQSSSNNYPPIYICDAPDYEACNVSTNPNLARNGSGWAWFGGVPSNSVFPEVATLTQNIAITIPQGGIVPLQFYLRTEEDVATGHSDFIRVALSGNVLFSITASDRSYQVAEYVPITLNLSAYANEGSHTLSFESTINSTSSFFIDDVSRPDLKFVNISKTVNFADDLLQPIIDKALPVQEIRAQAYDSKEDIVVELVNPEAVLTLKGGFGCDFAEIIPGANTTIRSLEIRSGKVIAQNLVLKGNL